MHISELDKFKDYIEFWKDIPNFEGYYQVSNLGRVFSIRNNLILKLRKNDRGYLEAKLSINGKSGYYKVHRLVAIAFLENPDNKPEVNHKDCNKENNKSDNLEWSTHKENIQHAFDNGRYNRTGEANSCNKVKEHNVVTIRQRRANGENRNTVYTSYKDVISFHGFKLIWYGYNWKHITIKESVI